MFTLEVSGKPIAITDADEAQARAIFQSDDFKENLAAMTSDGLPLWDGSAPFNVRPASEQEITAFEAPDQELDEDQDSADDVFVPFIVPIYHDHEETSAIPPQLQS